MDEKIKTQGKRWQKPELVVLVRSKPEEAVLNGCKHGTAVSGPSAGEATCLSGTPPGCGHCNLWGGS